MEVCSPGSLARVQRPLSAHFPPLYSFRFPSLFLVGWERTCRTPNQLYQIIDENYWMQMLSSDCPQPQPGGCWDTRQEQKTLSFTLQEHSTYYVVDHMQGADCQRLKEEESESPTTFMILDILSVPRKSSERTQSKNATGSVRSGTSHSSDGQCYPMYTPLTELPRQAKGLIHYE